MNCLSNMIFVLGLLLFFSCHQKEEVEEYDFPQILDGDTLRVLTLNSSDAYFIYRDKEMGYQNDLINDFCSQYGLKLKIIVENNPNALIGAILAGKCDVIAYGVPVDMELKDSILYCGANRVSRQVLIQLYTDKDSMITDVSQLIGKRVSVIKGTKYERRIENLNAELGGGIIIDKFDQDTIVEEDLIRMVASGKIKYTIADEYIAKLNKTYYRKINIKLPVSFDQRISWAVRKDMPILADSLNSWFDREHSTPSYQYITKKYFEETKGFSFENKAQEVVLLEKGQISKYDNYFKLYGAKYLIDWRILASICYHESKFREGLTSWAGAKGLMGIMPSTARRLGVDKEELDDPEINIRTGTQILAKIIRNFSSIKNEDEKIKISLAAYNGGIGHVIDARALTRKYGGNPDIWEDNVQKYLALKKLEHYYTDPVCKVGYFRANETLSYVKNVTTRWEIYKSKIP